MTTATRALSIGSLKTNRNHWFSLSETNVVISCLSFLILCSAFGVIYFKDLNRRSFIEYQNLQQARQQYEVEWGKLLLEQSTWSTQARIQEVAEQQFNMTLPRLDDVVLLEDHGLQKTSRISTEE
jgi:cell division protein FtsL